MKPPPPNQSNALSFLLASTITRVISLGINGDLDAQILRSCWAVDGESRLFLVADAALIEITIDPVTFLVFAKGNGVGGGVLLRLNGDDGVDGASSSWTRKDVGSPAGARWVGGRGDSEGTAVCEGSTNGEDDAEGHGSSEYGGHANVEKRG